MGYHTILPVVIDKSVVESVTVEEDCQAWRGRQGHPSPDICCHPDFFGRLCFLIRLWPCLRAQAPRWAASPQLPAAGRPRCAQVWRRGAGGFRRSWRGSVGQPRHRCRSPTSCCIWTSSSFASTRSMAAASRIQGRSLKSTETLNIRLDGRVCQLVTATQVTALVSSCIPRVALFKDPCLKKRCNGPAKRWGDLTPPRYLVASHMRYVLV